MGKFWEGGERKPDPRVGDQARKAKPSPYRRRQDPRSDQDIRDAAMREILARGPMPAFDLAQMIGMPKGKTPMLTALHADSRFYEDDAGCIGYTMEDQFKEWFERIVGRAIRVGGVKVVWVLGLHDVAHAVREDDWRAGQAMVACMTERRPRVWRLSDHKARRCRACAITVSQWMEAGR